MENLNLKTVVTLCHFHRKIGPLVFYSYPDGILDEDLSVRIANILDQTYKEGFFAHSFENLNSMNFYFEIHSDWARGNKEMLMASVILEKMNVEIEQSVSRLLNQFSEKLKSNKVIFKSFMIDELHNLDEGERVNVNKNHSLLKLWVKELYWATVEVTKEKTEEEKIATLLNNEHVFLTLAKLSKRPITLEGLKEWFKQNFPGKDFDKIIETLVKNDFIFVDDIGRVEQYVLLLKEMNAERIPPDSVFEYIDEIPELLDLIIPKVQQYFKNHKNKSEEELNEDSFTIFQIISDPKKYNLLSELRHGLIRKDKLPNLVSKRTLETLIESIDYLKQKDVIEELNYNNEKLLVLKTNLQITTVFPEYLRNLDEIKSQNEKISRQIELLTEFSERLKSNKDIFKSFMIDDLDKVNEAEREDIIKNNFLIESWIKELYRATTEVSKEKKAEEKIILQKLLALEKKLDGIKTQDRKISKQIALKEKELKLKERELKLKERKLLKETTIGDSLLKDNISVFLSYATKDSDHFKIKEIAENLKICKGIAEVLFYEGESYDNFIKFMNDNIGKCDVMLLFCSPNSLKSNSVEKEWTAADAIGKPLIPVFIKTEHIPPLLKSRNGVEFDTFDFQKTIKDIYNLILKKVKQ